MRGTGDHHYWIDRCPTTGSDRRETGYDVGAWGPCRLGSKVAFWSLDTGSHLWYFVNPPKVDFKTASWRFFQNHPMPAA